MDWNFINALVAIMSLGLTILLEWPKIKKRLSLRFQFSLPWLKGGWPLWIFWVTTAVVTFYSANEYFSSPILADSPPIIHPFYAMPTAFFLLGILQVLIIWREVQRPGWWILATGIPVLILIQIWVANPNSRFLDSATYFSIGLLQGIAQSIVLMQSKRKISTWWIVSGIAWPIGYFIKTLPFNTAWNTFPFDILVYEGIRAIVLVRLLEKRIPFDKDPKRSSNAPNIGST